MSIADPEAVAFALRPGSIDLIVCLPLERAGVPHGFCTRRGHEGGDHRVELDFGRGATPDVRRDAVQRTARAVGFSAEQLYRVQQIHSRDVVTVEDDDEPQLLSGRRADALVSRRAGVALGVLTADCVPILMADPTAGVIAAIHAGWRGAASGVVAAAWERARALGAEPQRTLAAIGPCISGAAYEVGPEVAEHFAHLPAAVIESSSGGRPHLDLAGAVASQLRALGASGVWISSYCTHGEPQLLHSFRREGERAGRQLSVIAAPKR